MRIDVFSAVFRITERCMTEGSALDGGGERGKAHSTEADFTANDRGGGVVGALQTGYGAVGSGDTGLSVLSQAEHFLGFDSEVPTGNPVGNEGAIGVADVCEDLRERSFRGLSAAGIGECVTFNDGLAGQPTTERL
ncbi:hypothetical protein [Streptomyces murinus]|uniref:hypothetical protein n=1 Tax=Streptomyces murinus TaxID=33900 RepID=UPI003F47DB6F